MMIADPNLLTQDELRGLLKCGRTKMYNLVSKNTFPFTYIGGERRFPLDAIEAQLGFKLIRQSSQSVPC